MYLYKYKEVKLSQKGEKMLIRFVVSNYRSFNSKQLFSMVAGKQSRHRDHLIVTNGKRMLKGSIMYGANASGKSNFIKAMRFGRDVLFHGSSPKYIDGQYFRIDPEGKNRNGEFQYDFISNGHIYSYGFAISYEKMRFVEEYLYLCDSNDEYAVFDRTEDGITTDFDYQENRRRFEIYAEDVADNKSFLMEIVQKKIMNLPQFSYYFDAIEWFRSLYFIFPESMYNDIRQLMKEDSRTKLNRLMRYFDTGIESVENIERPIEEIFAFLSDDVRNEIINSVRENLNEKSEDDGEMAERIVNLSFNGKMFRDGDIVATQMVMNHGNPDSLFELDDESDGTQRLFDLVPIYMVGKENCVILIDELDRSFHTKLTIEFIKKFYEKTKGNQSQLIATLHDANVMNLQNLRQDEIWFIERNEDKSSEIYSLNRYKERFDHSVAKDYLLGRYGAIPVFENWGDVE